MSDRKRVPYWIGILVFLGISAASLGVVVPVTATRETLEVLRTMRTSYLLVLLGLWFVMVSADAMSIVLFTRGTNERLGIIPAYRSAVVRTFFNVITPFGFGGQPMMIVSLRREGIPVAKASPIVLTKFATLTLFTLLGAVGSFVYFHEKFAHIRLVDAMFSLSAVLAAGAIVCVIWALLSPRVLIVIVGWGASVLRKVRIIKDAGDYKQQIVRDALVMRRTFRRYFSTHAAVFVTGILCNGVVYFAQIALLWMVLYGLGVTIPFVTGAASIALLLFLMVFMPTPGSAGLGEALFVLLFRGAVPTYMLGVAVLVWRVYFQYLSAAIGAVWSSKLFSDLVRRRSMKV